MEPYIIYLRQWKMSNTINTEYNIYNIPLPVEPFGDQRGCLSVGSPDAPGFPKLVAFSERGKGGGGVMNSA
jgi:hypothetical protein